MDKEELVKKLCKHSSDSYGTEVFNTEKIKSLSVDQLKHLSNVFAFEDQHDGSDSNENEVNARKVVPLTPDEVGNILQASISSENHNRDYLILLLFARCGFQPTEISGEHDKMSKEWKGGLRRRDIDFKRQILSVYSVRGGKMKREVPIDEVTLGLLRRYIKNADDLDGDYIFHNLTYDELIELPRKYGRRAKLKKKVSCRSFRHFYITKEVEAGVDLSKLQYRAGHKALQTTRKYMALK